MHKLLKALLPLNLLISVAIAAPVTCLPKPVGGGTSAIFKFPAKGAFVAWYCPGEELPTMFVCAKATCNLVTTQRGVAQRLSAPTLAGLQADAAAVPPIHFTDPNLIQVWLPYVDEIRALK